MTSYGTIPTSMPAAAAAAASDSASRLDFLSRAKERGRSALALRRPWRELVHRHAFSLPPSLGDAYLRIRTSLSYFAMNYAIVVLLVVFLSLLWHPVSLIVFLLMMSLWLFLYFLRDEPLVILGRVVADKTVLIVLSAATLAVLLLTRATTEILVSLLVGVVVIVLHAAFRRTDDLCLEEEAAGPGGWYAAVGEAAGRGYQSAV